MVFGWSQVENKDHYIYGINALRFLPVFLLTVFHLSYRSAEGGAILRTLAPLRLVPPLKIGIALCGVGILLLV